MQSASSVNSWFVRIKQREGNRPLKTPMQQIKHLNNPACYDLPPTVYKKEVINLVFRDLLRYLSYYLPNTLRHKAINAYMAFRNLRPWHTNYCKALYGESDYYICINSDLTVSCNCQDYDESALIGDLKESSLEEIFHGKIAQHFRSQLAGGNMPISQCSRYFGIKPTTRKKAYEKSRNWKLPRKRIMVEYTVLCNFSCVACDRSIVSARHRENGRSGGRLMYLKDIELIAIEVRKHSIERVYYFNQEKPFLLRGIHEEMQIFRTYNPDTKIIVSTNGSSIEGEDKIQAATLFDVVYFSIDGSNQGSVVKYQVGGIFERSARNMNHLVIYRDSNQLTIPSIEWNYVFFEWNDFEEEITRTISIAKEANIDKLCFVKGGMPGPKGESKRFIVFPFFRKLGTLGWQGRELILRNTFDGAAAKSP